MTPSAGMASGWYPDPSDPARLRKWDGVGWTDSWMAAPTGDVGAPRFTEPGWHNDPFPGAHVSQRWWDGSRWTDRVRLGRGYDLRPQLPGWFLGTALTLRGALLLNGLFGAASFGLGLWALSLSARGSSGEAYSVDEGAAYDLADGLLTLGSLALNAATGILFVTWLWAAYRSDRVDPTKLTHGSGWAIGAWFVPFLNLVRPYRLVQDLRTGIRSGLADERPDPRPHSVAWWWGAYLVMTFSAGAVSVIDATGLTTTDPETFFRAFRTLGVATTVDGVVIAVAAYLAYMLVSRLTEGLRRREFRAAPVVARTQPSDANEAVTTVSS
jgi:hypothetical protein